MYKEPAYTPAEIEEFSKGFNAAVLRQKQHGRASEILEAACYLKDKPLFVPGFINSHNEDGIEFEFPYLPHLKVRKNMYYQN